MFCNNLCKNIDIHFNPLLPKGVSLWQVKSSGVRQIKIYKWVSGRKGLTGNLISLHGFLK